MSAIRTFAYRLAVNGRLENAVRSAPRLEDLAYRASRRYLGGRNLEEALEKVTQLRDRCFAVSLDFFGEGLTDPSDAEPIVDEYLRAAAAIASLDAEVDVEVVPSHLGIDVSVAFFCERVARIGEGLRNGARLQVSAEESLRTESIVEASIALAAQGIPVVATIQANLRRSPDDVARLAGAGVAVRLVKGAYVEPAGVAHRWGEETDLAYVRLAQQLALAGAQVSLATHDPVLREALMPLYDEVSVDMLLGVRTDDADALIRRGLKVRIYVPYGGDWFRYSMRRRVESLGS